MHPSPAAVQHMRVDHRSLDVLVPQQFLIHNDCRTRLGGQRVANRAANVATPIFRDERVFLSSVTGCALVRLTSRNGSWRAREVYFNRKMSNHYSSSVLVGDYLYGFSSSVLTAMQWKTGRGGVARPKRRKGHRGLR